MKPLRKILKGGKAAAGPLLAGLRPTTASNKTIDNFTQPCLNCRATLRSESGFPFIGRTSSSILRPLRSDGPECSRDTATGRAWHVLPAGMWACGNRLDSDLGPTFSMPGLRPYYELIAGLAPSRAPLSLPRAITSHPTPQTPVAITSSRICAPDPMSSPPPPQVIVPIWRIVLSLWWTTPPLRTSS